MTKEQRIQQTAPLTAKVQQCKDCDCVCVQRITSWGMSFLCCDCEDDPPWVSVPSALDRMKLMGAIGR